MAQAAREATIGTSPGPEGDAAALRTPARRMKLGLIMVLVTLAGAAGGATWYFLRDANARPGEVPGGQSPAQKKRSPHFLALETFTVNLQPEQGRHQFLQVNVSLDVGDRTVEAEIKQHMPEIRNRLLLVLSSRRASEIYSVEGKEKLASDVRSSINDIVARAAGTDAPAVNGDPAPERSAAGGTPTPDPGPVAAVFFTSFVVQ